MPSWSQACILLAGLATATRVAAAPAAPATAAPLSALARMPIREITVFKDGHAFVLHEGKMPVDAAGDVQLDNLPVPVIGTFWPYAAEPDLKLFGVTASRRRVRVERTALDLRELIEANPGAAVRITGTDKESYDAKIIGVPVRSAEELAATSPPAPGEPLPQRGNLVLLEVGGGTAAVPFDQIWRLVFTGASKETVASEEFRSLLTLDLDWPGGGKRAEARVGMLYLQKGLRWIPGYKVAIDGAGSAKVELQATLVNELADLEDVTLNLVVGVPSFAFKETPDPIALQDVVASLGRYFDPGSATGSALSNAIMTQHAMRASEGLRMAADSDAGGEAASAPGLGPEVAGSGKDEDLFVFTVRHVRLARGARMVLPIASYKLAYRDVFTLDLPFAPPPELRSNVGSEQQEEMKRLLEGPKVMHALRIAHEGSQPLTTAPALIVSGDRLLGQGMMTYTPPGSEVDLRITAAVDIKLKRKDVETGRTANAIIAHGNSYARVDLAGSITLTSYRDKVADLELSRRVLGHADRADHAGHAEMLSAFDSPGEPGLPYWWNWYAWPGWWSNVNGSGRFTWKVQLPPGESVVLGYTWHYFWP